MIKRISVNSEKELIDTLNKIFNEAYDGSDYDIDEEKESLSQTIERKKKELEELEKQLNDKTKFNKTFWECDDIYKFNCIKKLLMDYSTCDCEDITFFPCIIGMNENNCIFVCSKSLRGLLVDNGYTEK
mgnify:CR=1 FL=1